MGRSRLREYTPTDEELAKKYKPLKVRWRRRHPDYRWMYALRVRGVTPEDYQREFVKQGGVCAICGTSDIGTSRTGRPKKFFHYDHDHQTGSHRGLLCGNCNVAIGMFKDDAALLRKASDYLDHWKEVEKGQAA